MPITIKRVLVATDFSRAGQRAVDEAAKWAREAGAQLRIIHVTPPKGWLSAAWNLKSSIADKIQHHAANALGQAAAVADPTRALELSTGVFSGPAARSILRAARDYGADVLVVGARGERDENGEAGLGGTSAKLLERAECPLLLVRRPRKDPAAGVVAALDLSRRSKTVLEWAALAAATSHLHAYHVYDVPFAARLESYGLSRASIDVYSEQERRRCEADLAALVATVAGGRVTSRVLERGDSVALLRRYIESVRPSLVVLGKHVGGKRPVRADGVGSVGRFTAASISSNVLVV
jgi:nucleotide-binding universal stress UspA family protein